MKVLSGGAAVIAGGEFSLTEATRRYRVPISCAMGARDIAQAVSIYSASLSPARRNRIAEEVLYVVCGTGACYVDGFRYELAPGTGVFVPPGSVYQIESADGQSEL
jgi:mannose-6-phosphate isomerase-like protein (cupin superfamily)